MAILLVMLARVLVRSRAGPAPPITPAPPRWQAWLARAIHLVLYSLLLATPLLGIATMAWKGRAWDFLGIPLPSAPTPDRAFAHNLENIHEIFGNILMYLAAAHALAAAIHHYLQRDDTLRRMLPRPRGGR